MRKSLLLIATAGLLAVTTVALASASNNGRNQARAKGASPNPVLEGTNGFLPLGETPAGNDWPFAAGDQSQTDFSTLKQINTGNVAGLKVAWQGSFDGPDYNSVIESSPLVISGKGKNLPLESGTMFLSANKGI